MKKRIISRVGMMLGVVVLAIGSMGLVRAQKDSPKMPSVISTIPVIEVLELRLKDSEQDLPGATAKIYLRNNSDKTIIAFTFEYGNENEDGGGYSGVKISDESGPVAGPKSDFTIDIPAGNFITGTPLRLMAIVFNDGSSAGEDVAASKLKKIVEEALKIKGRRVEPATTVAHTTILNRPPLELVSVRNSRGPVDLGQKLQQDKEWFKGLTLDLRNTSSKTIISFDISLSLESTQGTTGPIVVPFYFGMHPLRKAKVADDIRIPSGESYSVSISENDYSRLTSFINRRADVNSIDRASIVFTSIMFNDETGWNMNNFVRIDPTSPSGLTLIKQD